jgi:hypothetical protein
MDKKNPFGRVASSFDFCQTERAFNYLVSLVSRQGVTQDNELPVQLIGSAKSDLSSPEECLRVYRLDDGVRPGLHETPGLMAVRQGVVRGPSSPKCSPRRSRPKRRRVA